MNKDNAHLYLPYVQALMDGKTIQVLTISGLVPDSGSVTDIRQEWLDCGDRIVFDLPPNFYRIKPEKKWFRVALCKEIEYENKKLKEVHFYLNFVENDKLEESIVVSGNSFVEWLTDRVYYFVKPGNDA